MVKVRLMGQFEQVEALTRELRRAFEVVEESDNYANRKNGLIRRYLVVREPVEAVVAREWNEFLGVEEWPE